MGTIRLGKRTDNRTPMVKDFVPLASLDDLVFGGWDIFEDNCYEAAKTAGVLDERLLDKVKTEMEGVKPMKAVFDRQYVKRLDGPNVKTGKNKLDLAAQVRADIRQFKQANGCDRLVMIWCGSTEIFAQEGPAHHDLASFEKALETSDISIPSSMIYAYAAIKEGIPYANGAPNLSADIPALQELAAQTKTPITGKDFKTGQTLIKSAIAPGLKARPRGVISWSSTTGQGYRRGAVVDRPQTATRREATKNGLPGYRSHANLYPALSGHPHHAARINYCPPRGDNKAGWDNIDLVGW